MAATKTALASIISLACVLIASSASAVTMAWTPISNPGNACDPQPPGDFGAPGGCFGAVGYVYLIGTYEVTNAQYAEFLNAKAASDPLGLYNPSMSMGDQYGGITRSGSSGSYSYSTKPGRGDMPVNYVSFYDALRFANWMNNGQGGGDTETGAYTITAQGIADNSIARNPSATIFLSSKDEWYKAAYYDPSTASYFDYPAGSDTQTTCISPPGGTNQANCNFVHQDLTPVGSYPGSASPYGAFDQGGNVWEWNEAIFSGFGPGRGILGGSFNGSPFNLAAPLRNGSAPTNENSPIGFRVAMIPEPGTGLLVIAGLLGLAGWRRATSSAAADSAR